MKLVNTKPVCSIKVINVVFLFENLSIVFTQSIKKKKTQTQLKEMTTDVVADVFKTYYMKTKIYKLYITLQCCLLISLPDSLFIINIIS